MEIERKISEFLKKQLEQEKDFLNSLFGMVPVGGLFREKGGFCLEKRIF